MPCNLGAIERTIRAIVGVVLVGLGYVAAVSSVVAVVLYFAGAILIVTAAAGFCPAWKLLGLNTCSVSTKS